VRSPAKRLNPFQGLKRAISGSAGRRRLSRKTPESLSGIETIEFSANVPAGDTPQNA